MKDLDNINHIMCASKAYWGYDESFIDEFMDRFCVTEKCIREYNIYCVYIDAEMRAFYGFKKNDENQDELDLFFLEPVFIGKGVGRRLWQLCIATAKELKIQRFIIQADPNAEGFYLKMGCVNIGKKPSPMGLGREVPILEYELEVE